MSVTTIQDDEIEKMRIAGKMAAQVLTLLDTEIKPGITTEDINTICHDYITQQLNAHPAPLNYQPSATAPPFPKSICTSVNHVICHGIPSPTKKLKQGDIINVDITVEKDGFHGDTSKMYFVGSPSVLAKRLVDVTQTCLYKAIRLVRPGAHLGDIGHIIEHHAIKNQFSVVYDFCGHGIGKVFHGPPQVLHYGQKGTGIKLVPNMSFTIEPMINAGKRHIRMLPDRWTAVTKDHSLSAQWEHTILVTETGYEVLTLREEELETFGPPIT